MLSSDEEENPTIEEFKPGEDPKEEVEFEMDEFYQEGEGKPIVERVDISSHSYKKQDDFSNPDYDSSEDR